IVACDRVRQATDSSIEPRKLLGADVPLARLDIEPLTLEPTHRVLRHRRVPVCRVVPEHLERVAWPEYRPAASMSSLISWWRSSTSSGVMLLSGRSSHGVR